MPVKKMRMRRAKMFPFDRPEIPIEQGKNLNKRIHVITSTIAVEKTGTNGMFTR